MQVIVNCLVRTNNGIVMIRKPRKGHWVLPGGKVEPGELWPAAARREVLEETGLCIDGLVLRGIYLMDVQGRPGEPPVLRTLVQFAARSAEGDLLTQSPEGIVAEIHQDDLASLPMDGGDRIMIQHAMMLEEKQENGVFFGKFTYAFDDELVSWTLEPSTL